jgi:hypothetical protein
VLFADGAVFGHVASGLAHEPDWGVGGGLGFAGANEGGVGGGHFWTVVLVRVAFLEESRHTGRGGQNL